MPDHMAAEYRKRADECRQQAEASKRPDQQGGLAEDRRTMDEARPRGGTVTNEMLIKGRPSTRQISNCPTTVIAILASAHGRAKPHSGSLAHAPATLPLGRHEPGGRPSANEPRCADFKDDLLAG
jgi:hypothetical protein